ncbi:MAG: phenylalanine--tRNA ligase subunit beta [Candidatus Gracilibacteria bacterium]|jgi:phenylalanyl-tRNA synthetase beta chain|nr:phenylalanine--tRNA ligase subunit beta [Candidatus Gracilibacteria bacterium]
MHISLNWLKEFVQIPEQDSHALAHKITTRTAEVDGLIEESKEYENMVIGQIVTVQKHENADTLLVTKTSIGKETVQIVCGGQNLREGMFVAVALPGSEVKWHGEGEKVKIERTKIRGVESFGMICASSEIGLPKGENEGPKDILDLSPFKPTPGTPLSEFFKKDDTILVFDNKTITNRPDLWGHYGIAREIAALYDQKLSPYKTTVKIPTNKTDFEIKIEDEILCPRYMGLIIENIEVKESPLWLKERLKKTNHGTHNNIVDITNYVMAELGQPMHAFDKDFVKGKIIVRTARKGETIKALDEKTYRLDEDMLVIADEKDPIAIAGVMGGFDSGVNENTTTIILESANFNSSNIRRTSSKLGLRSDASQRFEKALDPLLCEKALLKAAELVLEVCKGAKIKGEIVDQGNFDTSAKTANLSIKKASSKIGADLSKKQITDFLKKLEFKITAKDKDTLEVEIPSFRATKDIKDEDDIIEEIARLYGYENIPTISPKLPIKRPIENTERKIKHELRNLLSLGLSFDEVSNYAFYSENDLKKCLMNEESHLVLENSISEEYTHLKTTLVPHLLKNAVLNSKNFDNFKIYEINRRYKEIGETYPLEEKMISGLLLEKAKNDNIFYEAKSVFEKIINHLSISLPKSVKGVKNTPYAHPEKALTYINHKGETLAKIFILHPLVQKNYDLEKYRIALFEINFTKLLQEKKNTVLFKEIPKFPKIEFDVSVLIDKKTEIGTLIKEIQNLDKELIKEVRLFDIYEGENIGKENKATAFKITLQSNERTLTDEDMSRVQAVTFEKLKALGGTIRGI